LDARFDDPGGTFLVQEKELRLALVCFGGVSLAVYMHGVTKEILKLVRASGALHAVRGPERHGASFFDARDRTDRSTTPRRPARSPARHWPHLDLRVSSTSCRRPGWRHQRRGWRLSHDLPMGGCATSA
jgi:hypothetical protein